MVFVETVHPSEEVNVVMRTSHEQAPVQGAATEHCPATVVNELSGFLNFTE